MKTNGTIYRQILTGGGMNEYGEPTEAVRTWDGGTPCLIQTMSDTRNGRYRDGHFRQSSFTVMVEGSRKASFAHVKLERDNEPLGEFDVLSVETLHSAGRIKIMV